MIKARNQLILFFMLSFLGVTHVYGVSTTCTYEDKARLNEIAGKVSANYEVQEQRIPAVFENPDTGETEDGEDVLQNFKISIYNVTDELYITETNDFNGETKTIFSGDLVNGIYNFETDDTASIVKYTYNVYSNLDDCRGEILNTFVFIKPKLNMFSQLMVCEGLGHIPYCQPYLTEELDFSVSELSERIDNVMKDSLANEVAEKEGFNKTYLYIFGGIGVLAASGAAIYFVIKKGGFYEKF